MKGKVGEKIKRLRERRDWSQVDLEEKTGINNSVLSRIEANKRPVQADELDIFADVFHVSADYLLGRTNDPSKIFSDEMRDIIDNLDLSDEEIRKKFPFELDGKPVTDEEFKWFIASVRSKRSME